MEHVITWRQDSFRLELWDTYKSDSLGKIILRYEFYHDGILIFQGKDFAKSPLHAIDSDDCVFSLLSFLSLCPGDTDAEYFDAYTPSQIKWRDEHAGDLAMLVYEHEDPWEE